MAGLQWNDMRSKLRIAALPLLVFGAGLAVTCTLTLFVDDYLRNEVHSEFDRDVVNVTAQTAHRLGTHFETLLSVKGLFMSSDYVDRREWSRFLEHMELKRNHAGFQGIHFLRYVPQQHLDRFIRSVRQDRTEQPQGYPDFDLKPRVERREHFVVEYFEPHSIGDIAFGVDAAASPAQLRAIELARDSGLPMATERVALLSGPDLKSAFLLVVPIYHTSKPTNSVAQRRAALFGAAVSVYTLDDLMRTVLDPQLLPHLRVRIVDAGLSTDASAQRRKILMFDSKEAAGISQSGGELAEFQQQQVLTVGQRRWELQFTALDGTRYERDYFFTVGVALSGLTISALVAGALVGTARHRDLSARLSNALGEQLAILDNATVGIEFIKNRHVQSCNHGIAEMLGYSQGELTGSPTRLKFVSQRDYDAMGEVYSTLHAGRNWIGDVEWLRKDGRRIWVRLHGKEVDPQHPEKGSIWVSYDITAQKEADAALQGANHDLANSLAQIERSHRDFSQLSEFSSYLQACPTMEDAFACIGEFGPRLFPASAGALYLMPSDKSMLERRAGWGDSTLAQPGFAPSDCWAMRLGQPKRSDAAHTAMGCPHLGGNVPAPSAATLCLPLMAQASTFGLLYLEHHMPDDAQLGDLRYHLAMAWAEDIGLALANLQLRETLRQQSIRDPLTGLFNRRHMNEVIEREFARAARSGAMVALAVIDVDHFKRINDSYGHDTGDVVLKAVAREIAGQVRECDIVCRFGGEEFVAILSNITPDAALARAEQIRLAISKLDCRHGEHLVGTVTASLGVALYPVDGTDEAALVHAADCALYQAKQGGRNRVVTASRQEAAAAA